MVSALVAGGLNLLARAIIPKGKEWLQEKTGVDVSKAFLSPEEEAKLRQFELENQKELMEIAIGYETSVEKEVTARHAADMSSDSWMSKNVRPAVLAVITVCLVAALFLPLSYIGEMRFGTVADTAVWVYGFYFGARSVFDKGTLAHVVRAAKK